MSLWNGFFADLTQIQRLFRLETAAAQVFMPAALLGTKLRKAIEPTRMGFAFLAAAADLAAIAGAAAAAALLNHFVARDFDRTLPLLGWMAVFQGLFFVAISAARSDYALSHYLAAEDLFRRTVTPWHNGFVTALVAVFCRVPLDRLAPLPLVSFFGIGFASVVVARLALSQVIQARAAQGRIIARRLFLIGFEAELECFTKSFEAHRFGLHIVAASVVRSRDSLREDLALARAYARILEPDDVVILVPWSDKQTIDAALLAFLGLPAAISLAPEKILDRFADARIAPLGPRVSLNLIDHPTPPVARFMKRSFDLMLASLGLAILAPLLVMIGLAIKLDSKGPIIFRQKRYGFNQQPFHIFKFRSLSICEDGHDIVAVERDDPRVTRIGAFLRRHNLDELPQLVNVLIGDMSLVGPRPLALVHDQLFEPQIALYARRHNVKPGITGWAQINGCRGGIEETGIRARIERDLYYIDHWSLWLDIEILWRTLTSKDGYRNAH